MKLGEKIKTARKMRKLTQKSLAGDKITRNMISRIESGIANPSLDTLKYLARKLSLPLAYLLSDGDDLFFYEKNENISSIYSAYKDKDFSLCINRIKSLSDIDSELAYIACTASYELGKSHLFKGEIMSASRCFADARKYSALTLLDARHILSSMQMYEAIAENVQSPLLEFDKDVYLEGIRDVFDYEFYKYLTQDFSYSFNNEVMSEHVRAKRMIKQKRYAEAVEILNETVSLIHSSTFNAYILFGVYFDLEQCSKELRDFENAYKYSNKRLSMLEGFKS
ncbi:MAG: helix-turn-helix transcriptional regulator [Clostridia bacterium]|nr:helix-turn-helix transcriptional regulator [Clostridia bacterium]